MVPKRATRHVEITVVCEDYEVVNGFEYLSFALRCEIAWLSAGIACQDSVQDCLRSLHASLVTAGYEARGNA